jgi:hypothetical protein
MRRVRRSRPDTVRRGQKLVAFSGVIVAVERTRTGSRLADETPHPRRAYTCATRFADLIVSR